MSWSDGLEAAVSTSDTREIRQLVRGGNFKCFVICNIVETVWYMLSTETINDVKCSFN